MKILDIEKSKPYKFEHFVLKRNKIAIQSNDNFKIPKQGRNIVKITTTAQYITHH